LAIANVEAVPSNIIVRAFQADGSTPAGNGQASLSLIPNGHVSRFTEQFVSGLPDEFTGILDVSSSNRFVALTLRALTNARGDFLLTSFPIAMPSQPPSSPVIFPQIADGGGYETHFILLGTEGSSTLRIQFFNDKGKPLAVGK